MHRNQTQNNIMQIRTLGDLADNELNLLALKRDILIGQIQGNYGISKKEAEKKVVDWEKTHDPWLIFDFIL